MMPGMAANPSIFEHIKLPEDRFKIHWLEWEIPDPMESLEDYAKRMCLRVSHDQCVLIGVSFGGILVQEMSRFLKLKKLIIISSVKSRQELPKRMKLAKTTRAYKLVPTSLVSNVDTLARFAFGRTVTRRIELYRKYLSMNSRTYLDWAIKQMIHWDQTEPPEGLIHIHGEKDMVFPIRNIRDCIEIEGGTHIMILNKFRWFNTNLPKLIDA